MAKPRDDGASPDHRSKLEAVWDDWSRVCDVAMDAPWNAGLNAIRGGSAYEVWMATVTLGFYRPQHTSRGVGTSGVTTPLWRTVNAIAERREQRALLRTIAVR
jgi:hypothetical protein